MFEYRMLNVNLMYFLAHKHVGPWRRVYVNSEAFGAHKFPLPGRAWQKMLKLSFNAFQTIGS